MANPQHVAWLKEGVEKWNARRQSQRFDPDLSSEDISRALGGHDREDIREISVRLRSVNLSGANLSNSTLRDTDLTAARFFMANLSNAKLDGSDFTGAQFVGGSSRGARFHSAKFIKTLFIEHDLTAAQFNGAELQETRFINALCVRPISTTRTYLVQTLFCLGHGPLYYIGRPLMTMLAPSHSMKRKSTASTICWTGAANSEKYTGTR